jgi:Right handed beta helix region
VNGVTGSDTTGDGSAGNPWRTPQKAGDYLSATATWPSSGDVAVNLRPAGYTFKGSSDPHQTLWLHFSNSAKAPNSSRWLIWRGDQGPVKIENPDGSDVDKVGLVISNEASNNYMVFKDIGFTGGYRPKGVAGHNGASVGIYLVGNNNHHLEFRQCEIEGFQQTGASTYQSLGGVFADGTTGPLTFEDCEIHDIGTSGGAEPGGHGLYLHTEGSAGQGATILNTLVYNMHDGFGVQFYNSAGGAPGSGAVISHCTIDGNNKAAIVIDDSASNVKIVNSIITNNNQGGIRFYPVGSPGSNNSVDHVVYYGNASPNRDTSPGWTFTNELVQNPLFVDRPGHVFRIAFGSPAIGYKDTAYSPPYDLAINPRPPSSEDAGSYEYVG